MLAAGPVLCHVALPLQYQGSKRAISDASPRTNVLLSVWKRQLACQRTRQLPQLKKLPLQLTSQRQSSLKQSLRDPRRLKGYICWASTMSC